MNVKSVELNVTEVVYRNISYSVNMPIFTLSQSRKLAPIIQNLSKKILSKSFISQCLTLNPQYIGTVNKYYESNAGFKLKEPNVLISDIDDNNEINTWLQTLNKKIDIVNVCHSQYYGCEASTIPGNHYLVKTVYYIQKE